MIVRPSQALFRSAKLQVVSASRFGFSPRATHNGFLAHAKKALPPQWGKAASAEELRTSDQPANPSRVPSAQLSGAGGASDTGAPFTCYRPHGIPLRWSLRLERLFGWRRHPW
jgi:hypothetical protein